jgi:uncharacterized alkaline shock family protein YloU
MAMSNTDPRSDRAFDDIRPLAENGSTPRTRDDGVLDCGRSVDELEDYLDAGEPRDVHIDQCPECQQALDSLKRMRRVTAELVQNDADHAPEEVVEGWLKGLVGQLALEVRAGRQIPLHHDNERARLSITEGAVRALIRDAGDRVPGIVVGRSSFEGDVTEPGAPVSVLVTASARHGVNLVQIAADLRSAILADLARHTELNVTAVDVRVDDLYGSGRPGEDL